MALLTLATWVGIAPDVCAQRGAEGASSAELDARRRAAIKQREVDLEDYGKGDRKRGDKIKGVEDRDMGPRSMKSFVVVTTGFDPRRVAPGDAAEMNVVVSIRKKVLIASPEALRITYADAQGLITLGDWRISDAKPSAIYPAFAGQLVYDDTFTITIPIQVAADAPHRVHPLRMRLLASLTNGDSGQPIGDYEVVLAGRLPVGEPLPTPTFRVDTTEDVGAMAANISSNAADRRAGESTQSTGPFAEPRVRAADVVERSTTDPAGGVTSSSMDDPDYSEGAEFKSFWLVGAGAIALLLALILARRR